MTDKHLATASKAVDSPVEHELFAGSTDLIVTHKITLAQGQKLKRGALLGKVTAGGKYKLSATGAGDGSEKPSAVLVHNHDTSDGDAEATVYVRGNFNAAAMTFGNGHTADSVRDELHALGIVIVKPYGMA